MTKPKSGSVFDADQEVEARLDREAEADFAAGRFVPHEIVREWLLKLSQGEGMPAPVNPPARKS